MSDITIDAIRERWGQDARGDRILTITSATPFSLLNDVRVLLAEVSRLGGELKDCTRERDKRKLEGDVMTEQCAKEVKYANDIRAVAQQEWERAEAMAKALKWALHYGARRDRKGDFYSLDGMMLTPPKEFREVLRALFSPAPADEESER